MPNAFTYRLPQELNGALQIGMRAVVPFGRQKLLTGIVISIHENPPKAYTAKYIDSILEAESVVNDKQIKFWNWISNYYMCHRGEVLSAALPAGLRLSSESNFILNPTFDGDLTQFSIREINVLEAIGKREVLSSDEVSKILELKRFQPVVKKLLDGGAILIFEGLKERYTPKIESYVSISEEFATQEKMREAFNLVSRAPKQEAVLLSLLHLNGGDFAADRLSKKTALQKHADASSAQINELVKKGILKLTNQEIGRIQKFDGQVSELSLLSEVQQSALTQIEDYFKSKDVVLLHGVTSSGKTEIYIDLIKAQLDAGKQVLFMLPEIALTTQMIERMQKYFGNQVAIYHSRFSQNERVEIWNKVLKKSSNEGRLIIGARSALFLPFSDLGLVIVDEEHEVSYKQIDPAPRYNGRDSAIVLAKIHGAKTLLGSATPSFETMRNAKADKFGYVEIHERFGGMPLPQISAAAMGGKDNNPGYFTKTLLGEITKSLEQKEQIILFQNRRGYAPVLVCQVCGWSPECVRCDVTTTFHKGKERLVCHYCGSKYKVPHTCHACGSNKLNLAGFGTERIAEEIAINFPEAKVTRLDLDSTRTKNAYQQIISDFQDGDVDILIGTQMVTKGLDFGRVSLVGILNADLLLKFPDFRSTERGFQLMTQVSGRAGRRKKQGKVLIQTYDPEQWVIQKVIAGDYNSVYNQEMSERKKYGYPPFARLILLTFRHRDLELVDYCAAQYFKGLKSLLPENQILGPEYPPVARVKNRYNKNLILKLAPTAALGEFKTRMNVFNAQFFAEKQFRPVRLIINVDPQ